MNDSNVRIGLHTSRFAKALVSTLRAGGLTASIESTDIPSKNNPGENLVYICLAEEDAAKGVALLESNDYMAPYRVELKLAGMSNTLLIPVDLTDSSLLSCRIGFELADRLDLKPLLLNVFTVPYLVNNAPDVTFPSLDDSLTPIEDEKMTEDVSKIASSRLAAFRKTLDQAIKEGLIKNLNYSFDLLEGIPEEAILEYTRQTPPALVVMATRGQNRKNSELIGSVTAEVLDNCRVPVFTVPENHSITSIQGIRKLAYFCNLDGQDIQSMEFLMRMFDNPDVEILLVPASKKTEGNRIKLKELAAYLTDAYPDAKFTVANFAVKEFRTELEDLIKSLGLELLIVPNKKTNIFSRLFNPAIPHRLLFERDIPMLALPV